MAQRKRSFSRSNLVPRIFNGAATFLVTQFCVMLISWPLMLWWGLPIATLNPLGNFVFNPFLGVFLLLSVVLFLAQLLMIPFLGGASVSGLNPVSSVSWLLEKFVDCWLEITTWQPWDWYLTFKRPHLLVALAIPIAAMLIMHYKPFKTQVQKLGALTLLFMISGTVLSLYPGPQKLQIACGREMLEIKKTPQGLCVTDGGAARRTNSAESWFNFVLMPELITSFGTEMIDYYHLEQITPSALAYVSMLCEKKVVRNLVVPHRLTQDKSSRKMFYLLKSRATASGVLVAVT